MLDLRGSIPTGIFVTTGKVYDVNILDELGFEAGSFYVMDRGSVDFVRLHRIQDCAAFFVTRAKSNFRFRRLYSRSVNKGPAKCSGRTERKTALRISNPKLRCEPES